MFRPLTGYRVLEISRLIPGAAVTHYFADYGADVVKIEQPPRGDSIREVLPRIGSVSVQHLMLDRNKRSIALDLKTPEGKAILHGLVRRADALVETNRPGVALRLGAGYDTLSKINPKLVYLSFTGFGQNSRYSQLPAHGSNLSSFAGVDGVTEREDGALLPSGPGPGRYQIPMEEAALHAAFALLSALVERDRTGRGSYLDMPLAHTLMAADYVAITDWVNNRDIFWARSSDPNPRYGYYKTKDGRVLLLCPVEDRFWREFCRLTGRADLERDGSPDQHDFANSDLKLYREVQRIILTRKRADWLEILIKAGIPCSPVNTIDEAVADPDLGGKMVEPIEAKESEKRARLLMPPVQQQSFQSQPPPSVGQDWEPILKDFSVPDDVIRTALSKGALRLP